jgi:hypothetical protein
LDHFSLFFALDFILSSGNISAQPNKVNFLSFPIKSLAFFFFFLFLCFYGVVIDQGVLLISL